MLGYGRIKGSKFGLMKIEAHEITLAKPGVYLLTASVFFATHEPGETLSIYEVRSPLWGTLSQLRVSIESVSPHRYTVPLALSPNYMYQSRKEDSPVFTQVIKPFADNTRLRVRAYGSFGHPVDHPAVLRASVRWLQIAPLQVPAA